MSILLSHHYSRCRRTIIYRGGSTLVGRGSQSVVVICRSTYETRGGRDDTCVVLLTEGLILIAGY